MQTKPANKELKPEQAIAAQTLDRHISMTAGPGAGKTTVLVERYLHILKKNKHLNIDQIVAITFTNRAANEMRERLRARLDELLQTSSPAERPRWMRYKRTLDGAIITTIHGFCSRLLREFPVEALIDPQFILLDEHQAAILLENAVEESLTEFINSGHEVILRLTAGLGRGRLASALAEIYRQIRGQGLSLALLAEQSSKSHSTWEQFLSGLDEVDHLINDLISFGRLGDKAAAKRGAAERSWPRLRQLLLDDQLPLGDFCRELSDFREAARPDARGPIGEIVKRLDELLWSDNRDKPFGSVPRIRFDIAAKEYACESIKILKNVDRRLQEAKHQLAALDFDDLQLRVLQLLEQPEVLLRAARRYKFFLVDEFQDTNSIQRDLMDRLALRNRTDANLFIVGDRKQSIYGFRGADVDVFREMTEALIKAGGAPQPLHLNFRSQPPLINFLNLLFGRLFKPDDEINPQELGQLGYVEHEPSRPERETVDQGALVELMVDTIADEANPKAQRTSRERDAQQLTRRIHSLTGNAGAPPAGGAPNARFKQEAHVSCPRFQYRDIALLFRAMTDVPVYESVFRRAGIPYQTVLGKGFYEREEITDLIQLLRFLDNRTDELALAAVLRSPLCGISDDALLALRLGPRVGETPAGEAPQPRRRPRKLFRALRQQREIDFIADEERDSLERAAGFLQRLIEKRNRYPVGDLLRFAVNSSEYATVVAANFDGAQRLANIQKLFVLAERFERSGAHLIRDFVKYVHDFEAIGSRESEGQLDDTANAVKLMTIHQAKGLEFPVVIIPDLQRISGPRDNWFMLDRHLGLTLKVPNGRGDQVAGSTFQTFSDRAKLREQFESLRLLYVAATRARDRLILSAATDELSKLDRGRECWLKWVWQGLELQSKCTSGILELGGEGPLVQLQFTHNLLDAPASETVSASLSDSAVGKDVDLTQPPELLFPLLRPIEVDHYRVVHRFSVTQLINYQRCPRQYYFDRVLHLPSADHLAIWNDAEAPEPPANLTATLKGAVIHRFCETYSAKDDAEKLLRQSFDHIVRLRQAELADRLNEINANAAIAELLPLAQNYLSSAVFQRIESAREIAAGTSGGISPRKSSKPEGDVGLWSELSLHLRRRLGILTGAIDKLLITSSTRGKGVDIEIIDFKTNRLSRPGSTLEPASISSLGPRTARQQGAEGDTALNLANEMRASRPRSQDRVEQIAFDFNAPVAKPGEMVAPALSVDDQVRHAAADYQLQMQAYALAVAELMPGLMKEGSSIISTLHFLEPNVEFHLAADLLSPDTCRLAIDDAMMEIVSSSEPGHFPVRPAMHCRMCNFLGICPAGREWLRSTRSDTTAADLSRVAEAVG